MVNSVYPGNLAELVSRAIPDRKAWKELKDHLDKKAFKVDEVLQVTPEKTDPPALLVGPENAVNADPEDHR